MCAEGRAAGLRPGLADRPEGFRRAITPQTRAIVLVHPNNPTGHFTKPWEAEELARLCREFDLSLIVDEVFLDYGFGGRGRSFAAGLEGVPVFVVSGLSKIAGLPQMKAAWIVATGPEAGAGAGTAGGDCRYVSLHECAGAVRAAGVAAGREGFRADSGAGEREPGRAGPAAWAAAGGERLEVEGGWYAVLRIPALEPDEQTVLELLERGVWVHPGYFFGMAGVGLAGGEPAGAGAGIQYGVTGWLTIWNESG
jgi:alanine-synthesizing transaminase